MIKRYLPLLLAAALLGVASGCHTLYDREGIGMYEVTPAPNEAVVVDQVIIIVDASGSMYFEQKFPQVQLLTEAFVTGMPAGNYWSGMSSFGGEWKHEWYYYPLQPFSRDELFTAATELEQLEGSTFMAEALAGWGPDVDQRPGHTAVVLFSDGKAENFDETMRVAMDMARVHEGPICFYTVLLGQDEAGALLMQNIPQVTDCGQFWYASDVQTDAGMEEMIRTIFFGSYAAEVTRIGEWTGQDILFGSGKAVIGREYQPVLGALAVELEERPGVRVELVGYTDATAGEAANQRLSLLRAQAVQRALVERGVAADRIVVRARGEADPVADNADPAARRLNRRVEVILLD